MMTISCKQPHFTNELLRKLSNNEELLLMINFKDDRMYIHYAEKYICISETQNLIEYLRNLGFYDFDYDNY